MASIHMEKNSKHSKKLRKPSKSSPSHQHKLVEYSDVSSNEFSAPEAGELPSDGLSIVSDDEISTIGNNNNIYEPIDDDDDDLDKLMDDDDDEMYNSETYSDTTSAKKRKKSKKKSKKLKKSKKRKRRRKSSDSIEEISDDDAILDEVDHSKKIDDGFTPPLDQISYTPKRKFDSYTPISRGETPQSINISPESPLSDIPPSGPSKRNDYRSPHTPPMPIKSSKHDRSVALGIDERGGHGSGRHSSLSSSKLTVS